MMVKNLLLIRHAEATHPPGLNDFDRPLSEHGYYEANKISSKLLKHNLNPDFIISSPAKRALSTAMIVAEKINLSQFIQPENMIYEATVSTLISIINHLPERYNQVAIFGHNPSITELVSYLTDNSVGHIPTAGIVQIELSENWPLVSFSSGKTAWKSF